MSPRNFIVLLVMLFLFFSLGFSDYVGKIVLTYEYGTSSETQFVPPNNQPLHTFFAKQIELGNLRLYKTQIDPLAFMEHHRYKQFYRGIEVYGGQIIQHYKDGNIVRINGEYYHIEEFDILPVITKDEAVEIFKYELNQVDSVEIIEESKLTIYPLGSGSYSLAYRILLKKDYGYCMIGFVDANTGEVLKKYSNIQYDKFTIGIGTGYHGVQYKLPTTYSDGYYYLYDEKNVRPANLYTIDWNFGGALIPGDSDNIWNYDSAVINAHVFAGWVYDYYYIVQERQGIDDNNMNIVMNVNWSEDGADNAMWFNNQMFYYIPEYEQTAAALDVIAHEYSHGVTQYESGLEYWAESGALNESFSDIIGAAVEHFWFPKGTGFLKADWFHGEDAKSNFNTNGCRNLANPNTNSQLKNSGAQKKWWYPDPCHLAQQIPILRIGGEIVDNGGVHLNMTIFSHAFYLLAQGGTNKISGISVNGVGLDIATKIFYRAWIYYLTETSNFLAAANALLDSAIDLYGQSSEECNQTIKAMEAIGYVYSK